ncbi:tRNA (adenosine(37)-N6)-dimethylallyltransferase MiaA [Parasedimentitalea marina]|uniref:tRNA dimethylallyltransferase n=1 Tax=Parasedimentitalea marina TaxID=2483033 RepID=A0A3T0N8R7_9RHOB|nr:tRNA (adenosine(37)-N6)-dimethylallyltransferase MiaA [Parasedimentitalea marina]AZV80417.1 tRNA (adenosine(37)-N6)-dimethylallyltransferase MiaA [Parasedimentitalea marina]
MRLPQISPDQPVLIAGPTASGKSALALEIAQNQGGVIINADASQVYNCWNLITARPSIAEEEKAEHALYGHLPYDAAYSAGHWLREVKPLLSGPHRPILVGGTGLYYTALTVGMAEIPLTPPAIRTTADDLATEDMMAVLDSETKARIDVKNRARVQRAWEVQQATGKPLSAWQDDTPPPLLPVESCAALVFDVDKKWLESRIRRRFDQMIDQGALDEARAMQDRYDPNLPSCRAIGVPELMGHLNGDLTLEQAREKASVATRQFAKRQRTWFRSKMQDWTAYSPSE